MKYRVWEWTGERIEIEAPDAAAAAQEYVDGGDFGGGTSTTWVNVFVAPPGALDDFERVKITVDPDEPDCDSCEGEHDWVEISVRGHGGGVIVDDRCRFCGIEMRTNTWAFDPEDGVQGLRSVCYAPVPAGWMPDEDE